MQHLRSSTGYALTFLLLAALCSNTAKAAGWIEDRGDRTVIHVVVHRMPDPADTSTANRAELAGIRAFVKRFPAIFAEKYRAKYEAAPEIYGKHNWSRVEVEAHPFSGIEVTGVENDLLAIAGDMAPDILYVNFRRSDNYIQGSFLYPLDRPEDGYITGMTDQEFAFRVHPKIEPVIRRKGPKGKEHVWALPYGGAAGRVLAFRKDIFDRYGVAHPTADWTWDDLLAAAKKLTHPEDGIYGLMFTRGKHESWWWVTFLWSAGGEVMVYDEPTDKWRCVFDSDDAAVALEFYTRLCTERWVDEGKNVRRGYVYKDADSWGKWDRGEIGMQFTYIDEKLFSTLDPESTGMVPVPLGPTGQRGAELNSRMMGLYAGIKERAVRDAAWEYLRYYDCEEAVGIKTRVMVEGGFGRFVNPKYLEMFGYPEVVRLCPKGWSRTFETAIATGKPEPYGTNSNFAYDLMTFPMQEAEGLSLRDELPADRTERLAVMKQLLVEANARANEEMIGILTPGERTLRDVSAILALLAIVVAFTWVFWYVMRAFRPTDSGPPMTVVGGLRKYAWAYALLVPAVLTILVWQYLPLGRGSVMALQDYRLAGDSTWTGVRNFGDILWDGIWWRSVYNALRYSLLVIGLTFLPPIILAILLQEVPRAKLLFRTIYYLPAVITGLVTVLLWKQFYDPSERGALNAILMHIPPIVYLAFGGGLLYLALRFAKRLSYHGHRPVAFAFALAGVLFFLALGWLAWRGLFPSDLSTRELLLGLPARLFTGQPEEAYRWLDDSRTAMLACVLPMVWAGMGPGCLIYLAALKGIPDDYYEAADIDGATFVDKVVFVVFPVLKPLIIINFVGVFIQSWYNATGNILVMTGGGADTEVAGLHIFYKAFIYLKFGPATAMAWMLGFMLIGFTVYQLKLLSRVEFRTAPAGK